MGVGQSLSESKTKIGEQIEKASGQETEDDGNETEDFEIEMEGEQLAAEDCVRKCIEEKKTNTAINGVIIENNEEPLKACSCRQNMKTILKQDARYRSCFLVPKTSKGRVEQKIFVNTCRIQVLKP